MLVVPSTSLTSVTVSSVRPPTVRTTTTRVQTGGRRWYTTTPPISKTAYIPGAHVSRAYRPSARRPTPSSRPIPRSTTIKPRLYFVQYSAISTVSLVPSTTTRPFLSKVPYLSTNSTVFRNFTTPQTFTPAADKFSAYDDVAVGAPALPDCPEFLVQSSSRDIM